MLPGLESAVSGHVQAVWLPVLDAGTFRIAMVRKGSPVRVRQRAWRNPLETAGFLCRDRGSVRTEWHWMACPDARMCRECVPDTHASPSSLRSRLPLGVASRAGPPVLAATSGDCVRDANSDRALRTRTTCVECGRTLVIGPSAGMDASAQAARERACPDCSRRLRLIRSRA
jgi:DNA-directed RNA polymerase subunit RPC12/RpoP